MAYEVGTTIFDNLPALKLDRIQPCDRLGFSVSTLFMELLPQQA
jgi:hypothetical protein